MSYFVQIKGQGEPVLFLHGFTGSSNTWHNIESILSCCAVMPDLSGHGQTTSLSENIESEAAAMKNLMNEAGFDSFHLIGYSMGGRLALALALLYPDSVRSLVLESASPGLKTEKARKARRASDELLAQKIEQEGVEAFVDFWENIPMFQTQKMLPESIRRGIREERLNQTTKGLAASLRFMGTGAQPSYWNKLNELVMPVLLLTGTLDRKFTEIACEMKKAIPFCEWIQFDGAGHAIHVEQREKFGTMIKTFMLKTKGGSNNGF